MVLGRLDTLDRGDTDRTLVGSWLVKEGLAPMFGPGLLYVFWCLFQWIASNPRKPLKEYAWQFALDPMGWLYVGAGVGLPCAFDCLKREIYTVLSVSVTLGAMGCVGLLLAGLTEKAKDKKWEPSTTMQRVAGALSIALLIGTS